MQDYEVQPFADLNHYAKEIARQNSKYQSLGLRTKDSESTRNARNRLAKEQAEYVKILGDLANELEYEQLVQDHTDIERQINSEIIDPVSLEFGLRRLGVIGLATRLADECYLSLGEIIAERAEIRLREIDVLEETALRLRKIELEERLKKLSDVFEVAGSAWPVPQAHFVAIPITDFTFEEPIMEERDNGAIPRSWEHIVDQPHASELIADYLEAHRGQLVTADELADFLYSGANASNRDRSKLRTRVTTMLGPKIQGQKLMQNLAKRGFSLEYGWVKSSESRSKKRAYRLSGPDETTLNP